MEKTSEMLKLENELKELQTIYDEAADEWSEHDFDDKYYQAVREADKKIESKQLEIVSQKHREIKVGDGITLRVYSDCHAYTVIGRTEKTITIQLDKATLKEGWKPEFIPGGFSRICTNQEEQEYDYEPDPKGRIITLRWSNKYNTWEDMNFMTTTFKRESKLSFLKPALSGCNSTM